MVEIGEVLLTLRKCPVCKLNAARLLLAVLDCLSGHCTVSQLSRGS